MALIKCIDCGADVSDAAPACLKCGRPIAAQPAAAPPPPFPAVARGAAPRGRGETALLGAIAGFGIGFIVTWGSCAKFEPRALSADIVVLFIFAGGLFAVVGAIIGAAMAPRK